MTKYPIGENCFIFEDNTIQPFVVVEDNVILWSGNHIGHHSVIKNHNFVSSHVVIDDYGHYEESRAAVDDFRESRGINDEIIHTDYTEVWWKKLGMLGE